MPWSSQAQIAQLVIIEGPNDGLFVYNGTPALGNLIASIAPAAGTDQFGNTFEAGITSYLAGTGFVELIGEAIEFGSLAGSTEIVGLGIIDLHDALTASATPFLRVTSPSTSGRAASVTNFIGQSADGTKPAQVVLSRGTGTPVTTELVEVQGSLAVGSSAGNIRVWYAPSGGDDFANLNTALSTYGSVDLLPGTYQLSAQLTVAGATLQGCDLATTIKPFGAYAGALLAAGNKGTIRNLTVANSGGDAITVAGGVSEVWLTDLFFQTNAGNCINWTVTGAAHGRIRGIRGGKVGSSNGGGIRIDGGTGTVKVAIINIYDVDIQQCNVSEVLFLSAVSDVLVDTVNGAIASGTAANAITVQGQCTTCYIDNVDVGGSSSGTGVAVFQAAGGNFPSDCRLTGKLQQGAVGLVVNDGTARSQFNVVCSNNQGDGAQFNGTGVVNKLWFSGNINNQAAGVAYDINVTSTVHLFVDAPQATGGAVTANCNITLAGNHVTVVNAPAGFTFAGNAQAGW